MATDRACTSSARAFERVDRPSLRPNHGRPGGFGASIRSRQGARATGLWSVWSLLVSVVVLIGHPPLTVGASTIVPIAAVRTFSSLSRRPSSRRPAHSNYDTLSVALETSV